MIQDFLFSSLILVIVVLSILASINKSLYDNFKKGNTHKMVLTPKDKRIVKYFQILLFMAFVLFSLVGMTHILSDS